MKKQTNSTQINQFNKMKQIYKKHKSMSYNEQFSQINQSQQKNIPQPL